MNGRGGNLSWWRFYLYSASLAAVVHLLERLQRTADRAGMLGVKIQCGITLEMLMHESEVDENNWAARRTKLNYERHGHTPPPECIEAERRFKAWQNGDENG